MTIKEIAQDFLQLAAQGASREAFSKYAGQHFIHHNAYFKGDGETLMLAMEEDARENPDKVFEILRTLEDGNLVAVHSSIRQNPDDLGAAVIHIFRFEKGKIAELWDFGQAVPPNMPNENGMF
ncbi:nuclear transport factor 2 family protein [Catalinimonas sp. 4WD22]|uniref:nuclear transport factor 2 family protein n=1 Tax=Catalinimonas locisalis TaxID=3133978 RepID=UPI00310126E1